MATWQQFRDEAPDMARAADERMAETGLVLVGTLRKDGWPRISPVEPVVMEGTLYLGMMYRSTKALDLRRDPRVLVHTVVSDKDGKEGEAKVYGWARSVDEPEERDRYGRALYAQIGWRPEGDFDLFAVDIEQAVTQRFGEGDQTTSVWRPGAAPATARRTLE
jgi:Pyridoxamine 5'-phosphate oxidase